MLLSHPGGRTPDHLRCGAPSRPGPPGRTQRIRGADGREHTYPRRRTRSTCTAVAHVGIQLPPGACRRTFRTSSAEGRVDNAERPGACLRTAHTSSAVFCVGIVAGPSWVTPAASWRQVAGILYTLGDGLGQYIQIVTPSPPPPTRRAWYTVCLFRTQCIYVCGRATASRCARTNPLHKNNKTQRTKNTTCRPHISEAAALPRNAHRGRRRHTIPFRRTRGLCFGLRRLCSFRTAVDFFYTDNHLFGNACVW